ncbi:hypothetical protein [Luteibacter sp. 22Crub2.1]|uniref:hypothetical protein n=1 Tax=Luteibacter sp. 22Crub2.1 TaxID=1283288 RepID=UPI0009A8FF3E|nr:hypothetical protein [Luteibacter sp. 22Crub2.1]SKB71293.1 hypothetical protein SAMN05660880_02289 [Luteibacter sp. 22Crub2.1]
MDNIERFDTGVPATAFRLSWVAYVRPVVTLAAALVIAWFLPVLYRSILAVLALAWFVYSVMEAREVRLFVNDDGIWVSSGILPWNRGVSGVKWRDLDEASFHTGFFSWAARSYRVRIGHRFTKSSEILLMHVHEGNRAVAEINGIHRARISRGHD